MTALAEDMIEVPTYVVGFLFDELMEHVVLLRKNKPAWQEGRLNGPGGKVEFGELDDEAMIREYHEETGILHRDWYRFCRLNDIRKYSVQFFFGRAPWEIIEVASDPNRSEAVGVFRVADLGKRPDILPNLTWLIPMALTIAKGLDSIEHFTVNEDR